MLNIVVFKDFIFCLGFRCWPWPRERFTLMYWASTKNSSPSCLVMIKYYQWIQVSIVSDGRTSSNIHVLFSSSRRNIAERSASCLISYSHERRCTRISDGGGGGGGGAVPKICTAAILGWRSVLFCVTCEYFLWYSCSQRPIRREGPIPLDRYPNPYPSPCKWISHDVCNAC